MDIEIAVVQVLREFWHIIDEDISIYVHKLLPPRRDPPMLPTWDCTKLRTAASLGFM
jgi:hypothetical protein